MRGDFSSSVANDASPSLGRPLVREIRHVPPETPTSTQTSSIDPDFLATLTPISVNKKIYKPMVSEIKDMYFKLYRGKGAEASVASEAAGSCTSPKGSSSGAVRTLYH